jgi:hypothetical protein
MMKQSSIRNLDIVSLVGYGYITLAVVEYNTGIRYVHLESRVDQDGGVNTANGSTDLKPRRPACIATSEEFKPVQIM